ncbi:uncharacterized protein LOC112097796 [Citrus clementina]|uniref:uncharacterized protein LOC112097796 n=1 Tax=Citrus clementina TaxID=85681 RepID=UPI000CED5EA7|nr:uncharacterized protein LOC112097796 [Citrus x clementina]
MALTNLLFASNWGIRGVKIGNAILEQLSGNQDGNFTGVVHLEGYKTTVLKLTWLLEISELVGFDYLITKKKCWSLLSCRGSVIRLKPTANIDTKWLQGFVIELTAKWLQGFVVELTTSFCKQRPILMHNNDNGRAKPCSVQYDMTNIRAWNKCGG